MERGRRRGKKKAVAADAQGLPAALRRLAGTNALGMEANGTTEQKALRRFGVARRRYCAQPHACRAVASNHARLAAL